MTPLLIALIVIAAAVVATGVWLVGRRTPSSVGRDHIRAADPKLAESLDQLPAAVRNPSGMSLHDRSFDRPH